jgi:hypothetical protein
MRNLRLAEFYQIGLDGGALPCYATEVQESAWRLGYADKSRGREIYGQYGSARNQVTN